MDQPHADAPPPPPLLALEDLRLRLRTARGALPVLHGVSLRLARGETLGLIGESGCGKSMTALALAGLLPEGAEVEGALRLDGEQLLGAPEARWCRLRGARVGMVFQEPMTALDPLQTIGRQVAEPLRLHRGLGRQAARAEALRLLERVQLPQAAQRLDAYPHQLSGGQRQRVLIAAAIACGPDLLIADEPTSALDAGLRREMLQLLRGLAEASGMALLLISHDLALVGEHVERVAVMYAGRIVDEGPTAAVFARRAHPYTRALFEARPRLGRTAPGARLPTLPGRVPPLHALPPGCAFAPRCARAAEDCRQAVPALRPLAGDGHALRCLHPWPDEARR
ncbi:ABC transporter ATP-binding protein [Piscinibacter sakaiensis]|uniref:Oligopeptide transport ATP-binding protein OppD n=1 Tax=Piscinibacter sakaiensis TaxID=1547922 RepID=A0A0K8P093_PISS1|nr:ABC transporter ATP-binding protein [Piscinibacter sakaiensis]GAP35959.1 oligopeptide transport ATP-binding protein OppD [Piscinibacter sakaiensis]